MTLGLDELQKMLLAGGAAGADQVSVSCNGKTVQVSARRLWDAIALSKPRENDGDIAMALFSISMEANSPAKAIELLVGTIAAAANSGGSILTEETIDLICKATRLSLNSCRAEMVRRGVVR